MDAMALYQKWLTDFAADAETVADLNAIKDDPAEIEDRFYRELEFGTAGMRGVLGAGTNRMNVYNVRRVTRALAKYILTVPGGAERASPSPMIRATSPTYLPRRRRSCCARRA